MMSLQTNNRIVHVMTAKLSVGFNSAIARQIEKAFFQVHLHLLKNRTRNVHDQLGRLYMVTQKKILPFDKASNKSLLFYYLKVFRF